MKNNGGFIPGIRPGKPTIDYLNRILSRLTLAGALFLASYSYDISILSYVLHEDTNNISWNIITNSCWSCFRA